MSQTHKNHTPAVSYHASTSAQSHEKSDHERRNAFEALQQAPAINTVQTPADNHHKLAETALDEDDRRTYSSISGAISISNSQANQPVAWTTNAVDTCLTNGSINEEIYCELNVNDNGSPLLSVEQPRPFASRVPISPHRQPMSTPQLPADSKLKDIWAISLPNTVSRPEVTRNTSLQPPQFSPIPEHAQNRTSRTQMHPQSGKKPKDLLLLTPTFVPAMIQRSPPRPGRADHPAIRQFLNNLPGLKLDVEKCKDKARGVVFHPLAQYTIVHQLENDHIPKLNHHIAQLKEALAGRLYMPSSARDDALLNWIACWIYRKAKVELGNASCLPHQFIEQEGSDSYQYQQIGYLHQIIEWHDNLDRGKIPPQDLPSANASRQIAAWNWQLEIHDHWIAELEGDGKRRGEDDDQGSDRKARRIGAAPSKPTVAKRRPGRPPGARNKSTVAAEQAAKKVKEGEMTREARASARTIHSSRIHKRRLVL